MATTTFNYTTGAPQNYVVPAGVFSVLLECWGASGFDSGFGVKGGPGGHSKGRLAVTPGETLTVNVGQHPSSAFNNGTDYYGPGGFPSDVRQGGTSTAHRVIIAGGGGGAGPQLSSAGAGGSGGGLTGASGANGLNGYKGGAGGTQTTGGVGGLGDSSGQTGGTPGTGGIGGIGARTAGQGGHGYAGGGGGGGGNSNDGGGGGGGSGWLSSSLTEALTETSTWTGHGRVVISTNAAPNAATLTTLIDDETIDRAITNRASHTFSDPNVGDTQSKADHRWRLAGTADAWATETIVSPNTWRDFPAGSLAAGRYERQVLVYDSQGTPASSWSALGYFVAADAPASPTITDPINGATISTETYVLRWSTPAQDAYEVQQLDAADAFVWGSGVVESSIARSHGLSFESNNVTRKLRLRIRVNGLWSGWVTITNSVSYTTPAQPTASATLLDENNIGMAHVLRVAISNPVPVGDQPTVTSYDVFVRELGDDSDGVRVAAALLPSLVFSWREAAATQYEVRVRAYGDNETSVYSEWLVAPTPTIRGFLLHDPSDASSLRAFRLNGDGARDSFEIESALLEYAGREFPVVEYGDSSSHTIEVPLVHAKSDEAMQLRELMLRRSVLCYRDRRGRKMYGVVSVSAIEDVFYGQTTSLRVTRTDYDESV